MTANEALRRTLKTFGRVSTVMVAATALFLSIDAEARFGKSSAPAKKKSSSVAARPSPNTGRVHGASPAGLPRRAPRYAYAPRPSTVVVYDSPGYVVAPDYGYRRSAAPTATSRASAWQGRVFLGTQGQVFNGGGALGVQAFLEGRRWGFNAEVTGIAVGRDDGYAGVDTLSALDLHLTYAFLSTKHARLRLHLGADSVFAPQLAVMGPSVGASLDVGLRGPFGLNASIGVTPFPYQQVDAQVGGTLALGPIAFRGGLKGIWLDDMGLVDGVSHRDAFIGPYLGLALVF